MLTKNGNLFTWENLTKNYDIVLFTANSVVTESGGLVMGAGAAKLVKEIYREAPFVFGRCIRERSQRATPYYGVIITSLCTDRISHLDNQQSVGAFQTKYHWRDFSPLDLIQRSTDELAKIATLNHGKRFALNYPGIGKGGLTRSQVAPIIQRLPDNVHIWDY